jgi:protein ImuB
MKEFAPPAPRDEVAHTLSGDFQAAFRVCRPPVTIGVTQRGKQLIAIAVEGESYAVVQQAGPWRKSGQWWSQANWCREEWDVLLSDRVSEKICRIAHDPSSPCWYLVGTYD